MLKDGWQGISQIHSERHYDSLILLINDQSLNVHMFSNIYGFLGGARGKEPTCQCKRRKRGRFDPWVRKIPWRRKWQPTPVFLPGGESHGQRSLGSYGPWGRKRVGHDLATKQQQQQKLLIPSWVISDRILHSCMSHNFLNSLDLWSKFYLGLPASSPEPSTIRNILHLACWKVSFFF